MGMYEQLLGVTMDNKLNTTISFFLSIFLRGGVAFLHPNLQIKENAA